MTKQTANSKPKWSVRFFAWLKKLNVQAGIGILACILFWLLSFVVEPGLLYTLLLIAGAFSAGLAVSRKGLHIVNELINRWEVKLGHDLDRMTRASEDASHRMVRYYSLSKDRGAGLFGPKIECESVEIIVEIKDGRKSDAFMYSITYKLSFGEEGLTESVRFQVLVAPFPVSLGQVQSMVSLFPQRSNLVPEDLLTIDWSPIYTGEWLEENINKLAKRVRDQLNISDQLHSEGSGTPCTPYEEEMVPVKYGWFKKTGYESQDVIMPARGGRLRQGAAHAFFSITDATHPHDGPRLVVAPPTRCTKLKVVVKYPHGFNVDLIPYVADWLVVPAGTSNR